MRQKILIGVLALLVLGVISYEFVRMSYPPGEFCCQASGQLQTYTNEKYSVEFKYPAEWQVTVDESIPVINVYKKSETAKPPFTIHSNVTAIAIFPEGLGTEGPLSQIAPTKISFSEDVRTAQDLILQNATPWATMVYFTSTSTKWNEFGFVWAGLQVENAETICIQNGKEAPAESCDMGVEFVGASFQKKGTVNSVDRDIEVKILQSVKLTGKKNSISQKYQNEQAGIVFYYPKNYIQVTPKADYFLQNVWKVNGDEKTGKLIADFERENSNEVLSARIRIGMSTSTDEVKSCAYVPADQHFNTVTINGTEFTMYTTSDAAMSHHLTVNSFRGVYNSTCYAIDEIISGTNPDVYDPPKTVPFEVDLATQEMMYAIYSLRLLK